MSTKPLPYAVPPFNWKSQPKPPDRFYWWSWHPLYPYWSKSCWGAPTKEAALLLRETDMCGGLDLYYNKLIDESVWAEVADDPLRETVAWDRIAENQRAGKYAKRTDPIAPLITP